MLYWARSMAVKPSLAGPLGGWGVQPGRCAPGALTLAAMLPCATLVPERGRHAAPERAYADRSAQAPAVTASFPRPAVQGIPGPGGVTSLASSNRAEQRIFNPWVQGSNPWRGTFLGASLNMSRRITAHTREIAHGLPGTGRGLRLILTFRPPCFWA